MDESNSQPSQQNHCLQQKPRPASRLFNNNSNDNQQSAATVKITAMKLNECTEMQSPGKSSIIVGKYGTIPSSSKLAAVSAKNQASSSPNDLDTPKKQSDDQSEVPEFQRVFSHLRKVSSTSSANSANNNNNKQLNQNDDEVTLDGSLNQKSVNINGTGTINRAGSRLFPKTLPSMQSNYQSKNDLQIRLQQQLQHIGQYNLLSYFILIFSFFFNFKILHLEFHN